MCRLSSNRSIGLHLNHFQLIDGGEERPLNTCINTRRKYRSSSTRATLQVLVQLLNLKVFLYHSFFLLWILESVCLCVERGHFYATYSKGSETCFVVSYLVDSLIMCMEKKNCRVQITDSRRF